MKERQRSNKRSIKDMISNASRSNAKNMYILIYVCNFICIYIYCKQYKRSNARSAIRNDFGRKCTGTSFQFDKLPPRGRAWDQEMVAWIRSKYTCIWPWCHNHHDGVAKQRKKNVAQGVAGWKSVKPWDSSTLKRKRSILPRFTRSKSTKPSKLCLSIGPSGAQNK